MDFKLLNYISENDILLEFFIRALDKYGDKFKWSEEKTLKLKKAFEDKDKILIGAYEVYLMFLDEDSELEFADTANRFSKIK